MSAIGCGRWPVACECLQWPRLVVRGLTQPINGDDATCANGGTIGFECNSPEQVRAFHDTAPAHGGKTIEDPPGLRDGSMGPMFLAYVRDPDGHKLCAMYRGK